MLEEEKYWNVTKNEFICNLQLIIILVGVFQEVQEIEISSENIKKSIIYYCQSW